jgi:hypothetical protein
MKVINVSSSMSAVKQSEVVVVEWSGSMVSIFQ